MRKFRLLLLFMPLFGFSQNKKNVVNVERYFPKMDKALEFEKALTAHIQKYHTANWKWRIYSIDTGPDAGGYQVVEGPNTWDEIDKRGDLGAAHLTDWNKNVAIYLTDKYSSSYIVFNEELSSVQITDYSDKISVTHVFPKIGEGDKVEGAIKSLKKTWDASGQSVAVYESSSSGPAQYSLVTRYKQGLKEKEAGFRKPFKERFEGANGDGSYDKFEDTIRASTDNVWSEMLSLRKDLSSK
jgi:hypothetical protein